jgi:hypothetical protein
MGWSITSLAASSSPTTPCSEPLFTFLLANFHLFLDNQPLQTFCGDLPFTSPSLGSRTFHQQPLRISFHTRLPTHLGMYKARDGQLESLPTITPFATICQLRSYIRHTSTPSGYLPTSSCFLAFQNEPVNHLTPALRRYKLLDFLVLLPLRSATLTLALLPPNVAGSLLLYRKYLGRQNCECAS